MHYAIVSVCGNGFVVEGKGGQDICLSGDLEDKLEELADGEELFDDDEDPEGD